MDKQKIKHIKSAVENKKPTAEQLDYGQLSINFNANNPFLAIKDNNDEIVTFPSERSISGIVQTQVSEEAVPIIQEILPTVIGEDYYTKQQTDAEINALSAATDTKLEGKADVSDIPSLDGYATEEWVGEQGYLTQHQSLDNYYTKSEVDSEISGATNDMATQTWVGEQGYLTQHQDISNLATKQEVNDLSGATDTKLEQKANVSDIPDVSNYFDDVQYDSNTKRINFYHGESIKAYVDATDFIKDGMVDNVDIETLSGSTYLVIAFNTDSGKESINIPIADIFNAANYYTKSEVDSEISGSTADMATQTWVGQQGYLTEHQSLSAYSTTSEVEELVTQSVSGKQDTLIAGENITINGNTISATGGGGSITIDPALDPTSQNAVTNSAITKSFNEIESELIIKEYCDESSYTDAFISGKKALGFVVDLTNQSFDDLKWYFRYLSQSGLVNYGISRKGLWYDISNNVIDTPSFIDQSLTYYDSSSKTFHVYITEAHSNYGYFDYFANTSHCSFTIYERLLTKSVKEALNGKQDTLIAGENITISGNTISATGGGGGGSITIDPELDGSSSNAVANSAITASLSSKQDTLTAGYGIELSGNTISVVGGGGGTQVQADWSQDDNTQADYIKNKPDLSSYSTTSEVEELISQSVSGKQDTLIAGENITISGNTISATGGGGGGGMTEDTELLLATAITDLNDRKADTNYVRDKLKNYQAKGDYVTTSALNTRLADYETALDEQNIEEVASYALNDLNNRKQDKLIAGEGISISGNTISATGGGGGSITVDTELSSGSTNPVANSAITASLQSKQDTLTPGYGIEISGNTISVVGGGGGTQVQADWSQSDNTQPDYIKNKPTIPTSTSSVISGSTENITSGGVFEQFDGMKLKKLTQADYDLLPTKDADTLYIILNNN